MMKIRITMVSGEKHVFENSKYKNVDDWIKGNFQEIGEWLKISPECDFVIRINNIEKIEVFT